MLLLLLFLPLSLLLSPLGRGVTGQVWGQRGRFLPHRQHCPEIWRCTGTSSCGESVPTLMLLREANQVLPRLIGAPWGAIPGDPAQNASTHSYSTSMLMSQHFLFKRGCPSWGLEDRFASSAQAGLQPAPGEAKLSP